jgi:hypothetical protein
VSRNARFRGVRGEKNYPIGDLFDGGFLGANAALLFYALKWYNYVY